MDARRQILNRLIDSARIANAISPSAWAVTLSSDFFRLNVGPVEVYVAYPGGFFINCAGSIDIAPFNGPGFETVLYKSMPGPNCVYRGKPNDLTKLPKDVLQAHAMFIDNASTTSTGKPRTGTLYRKSHSEGLIKYARLAMKEWLSAEPNTELTPRCIPIRP